MSARDVVERLRTRRVIAEVQTSEGPVYVFGMNGKERAEYWSWIQSGDLMSDHKLLARVLCEESGTPLFAADEAGQAAALDVLQDWAIEDVTRASKKCLSMSGMSKDSAEDGAKK